MPRFTCSVTSNVKSRQVTSHHNIISHHEQRNKVRPGNASFHMEYHVTSHHITSNHDRITRPRRNHCNITRDIAASTWAAMHSPEILSPRTTEALSADAQLLIIGHDPHMYNADMTEKELHTRRRSARREKERERNKHSTHGTQRKSMFYFGPLFSSICRAFIRPRTCCKRQHTTYVHPYGDVSFAGEVPSSLHARGFRLLPWDLCLLRTKTPGCVRLSPAPHTHRLGRPTKRTRGTSLGWLGFPIRTRTHKKFN